MKFYLFIAIIFFVIYQKSQAQNIPLKVTIDKQTKIGERIFIDHADNCLAGIEKSALDMSIKGVAIIAFIPGDTTLSWISKMKVVGALTFENINYLAIAGSKASEMASTLKNSGIGVRAPMAGEFGYPGGVIKKVRGGYILAVFSGGTGDQDLEAANKGLGMLSKFYIGSIDNKTIPK
jgi:hypothetical protein